MPGESVWLCFLVEDILKTLIETLPSIFAWDSDPGETAIPQGALDFTVGRDQLLIVPVHGRLAGNPRRQATFHPRPGLESECALLACVEMLGEGLGHVSLP